MEIPDQTRPKKGRSWKKWILLVIALGCLNICIEHIGANAERNRKSLQKMEKTFRDQLKDATPFHITKIYFGQFLPRTEGHFVYPIARIQTMPEILQGKAVPQPPPVWEEYKVSGLNFLNPWSYVMAGYQTAKTLVSEGPMSIVVLLVGIAFAAGNMRILDRFALKLHIYVRLALVFCATVVLTGCFIWLLLIVATVAARLFGWFLDLAGIVVTIPVVGWLLQSAFEERGHHWLTKLIY